MLVERTSTECTRICPRLSFNHCFTIRSDGNQKNQLTPNIINGKSIVREANRKKLPCRPFRSRLKSPRKNRRPKRNLAKSRNSKEFVRKQRRADRLQLKARSNFVNDRLRPLKFVFRFRNEFGSNDDFLCFQTALPKAEEETTKVLESLFNEK